MGLVNVNAVHGEPDGGFLQYRKALAKCVQQLADACSLGDGDLRLATTAFAKIREE
jgi:hypothetical protein